jgi:deoxyribonuclease V
LKYRRLHSWDVSPREAIAIQKLLRGLIEPVWKGGKIGRVAAADVGFPDRATVRAAIAVLSFPDFEIVETSVETLPCHFPYVPGLLSFREIPGLLAALEGIRSRPDVFLCDGQGIAHRRRMGLAAHVGLLLRLPVIGCAKSVLYGRFEEPAPGKGAYTPMIADDGEIIGAAVRTRDRVKPVYVSVGNRIDLKTAVEIVLKCATRYRIPEPLRAAHRLSVGKEAVRSATGRGKGSW